MIDLHPALSGLPLASALLLISVEAMFFIPKLKNARRILRIAAVMFCIVSVVAAFLSGYQASSLAAELYPRAEETIGIHHAIGRLLLIDAFLLGAFLYFTAVATHGRRVVTCFYYLFVATYVFLVVWVGYLGGQLVFEHGVNVKRHETPGA